MPLPHCLCLTASALLPLPHCLCLTASIPCSTSVALPLLHCPCPTASASLPGIQESPFTKQKMCTTDLQRNLVVEHLVSEFKKNVSTAQRNTQHQQHSNKTQVTPSVTDSTMFTCLANEVLQIRFQCGAASPTLPPTHTAPFMLSLCVQTIGEASTQDKDRLEKLLYQHECDGLTIEVQLPPQPPFCIASLILLHCIVIDKSCPHSPPPQDCIGSGAHGHHPSEIQVKPCTDTLTH